MVEKFRRTVVLANWRTEVYVFGLIFKIFLTFCVLTSFCFVFLAACVKCDGPVTGNGSSGGGRRQHIYQGLQCRTVLEDISDDDQEDGDTVDEVRWILLFLDLLFSNFSCRFLNLKYFSNLNVNCYNVLYLRNLQEQVKKLFRFKSCYDLSLLE
jgi:hypothetical protein